MEFTIKINMKNRRDNSIKINVKYNKENDMKNQYKA